MAKHQVDERKNLERIMSDRGAKPISLSYGVLSSITNDFSADRVIGSGGFGVVYLGILQNWKVAVKKLTLWKDLDDKLFMGEVGCLMSVQHKNIVRFVGYCIDKQVNLEIINGKYQQIEQPTKLLCFEYVPNGDLQHYLKEKPNKDVWHIQYLLIKGICEGLKYLHDKNICHMDLKPENILLDADIIPKITDFGLARSMDEGKTTVVSSNIRGTKGYVPPESIDSGEISLRSDIYALGIIMMELLTGQKFLYIDKDDKSLEDYGDQVKSCIEIALTCSDLDKYKRPRIETIIEKLNELAPPVVQGFVNEMASSSCTEGTQINELLDVYPPRHVPFFFNPNKLITSPLRLRNKTDDTVAFRLLSDPESHIDCSEVRGVLPPRSTRTYLLPMEKQPPASFVITLECCIASDYIVLEDLDDNFSPENPERNELHAVALVATMYDQGAGETTQQPAPSRILTKVICCYDMTERITTIDVHPTEPWILASHYGGRVTIWDYNTEERVIDLKIREDSIVFRTVAFIARNQWLMAGDDNGQIHVRSYITNEVVKELKAHDSCVMSLSIHPNKPLLLSASVEGVINLWDWTDDWKRIRTFNAHSGYVEKVMFNPTDSNFFASVGLDSTLKIWKTASARCDKVLNCQGEDQLSADYFQPPGADRQYMITGSSSGKARIWDLKTYKCIRKIEGLQDGHGCNVGVVLNCLPDRQLLVTAMEGHVVSLYNFNTKGCENMIDFKLGRVRTFAYVEAINSVVIGSEGGIAMMGIN